MDGGERRINARVAIALLVVEGYCSLAVEMIALRVLVPVAGQSIGVTGTVVAVFLGALALGYRDGGRFKGAVADRVAWNLAVAAAGSAFWLSRFGVALAFEATAWLPPLVQVAIYAVVGVGAVAYLLAHAVVLLVGSGTGSTASGKAGRAFSASTLGNVAGGLLTALVVMQWLGVAGAVALVAGLLLIAAFVARGDHDLRLWVVGVGAAAMGAGNLVVERNEYVLSTAHADYAIEADVDGGRLLRVNGQNASREDGGGLGHPYLEWIEDEVYGNLPAGHAARVLVVGAGGFTFGRGRPDNQAEIVFVDIDGRLDDVADAFLGPGKRSGTYVPMDGRAYLVRHVGMNDAIVLDAFVDRAGMPAHLHTREFFELARSRLAEDGGAFYLNLIVPPRPDKLVVRVERTLRSVFAWCRTHRAGAASGWHNLVFKCARSGLDGDETVYTDYGARGEVDGVRY